MTARWNAGNTGRANMRSCWCKLQRFTSTHNCTCSNPGCAWQVCTHAVPRRPSKVQQGHEERIALPAKGTWRQTVETLDGRGGKAGCAGAGGRSRSQITALQTCVCDDYGTFLGIYPCFCYLLSGLNDNCGMYAYMLVLWEYAQQLHANSDCYRQVLPYKQQYPNPCG